jgi:hypothetical protein
MAGTARSSIRASDNASEEFFELVKQHNYVIDDLETLRKGVAEFVGSTTWNPSSIADTAFEAKDITVTGAALGDFVQVSFDKDIADLTLWAGVTATNTVTAVLYNNTGGAIDAASGTLNVRVSSPTLVDAAGDLTAATVNA